MSLEPSCSSLYFPTNVPRDNIIKLQWKDDDNASEWRKPYTMVIYKVKCTSPQLFHVLPRYGALLVADASGNPPQGFKGGNIVFALKENYAQARDESPAQTTPSTPQSSGAGRYQHRFSVEYILIRNEPLVYQQVVQSLSDQVRLTDVVKNVWSLVSANAITASHVGKKAALSIKAYTENVVLSADDPSPTGNEQTKVVVPKEATLMQPSLHERLTTAAPRNTESGKPTDELRALKEELHTLRTDRGSLSGASGGRSPSLSDGGGAQQPAQPGSAEDILMKGPCDDEQPDGSPAKKKKGLKLYLVIVIMFVVYVITLFSTRGSGSVQKVSHGGARSAGSSAGGAQLSGSSSTVKAPKLPSSNNHVVQL